MSVTRSAADEQGGFSWDIEFLTGDNAGNIIEPVVAHGDGDGALIENVGGVDGSYISGSFTLSFRESQTRTTPFAYAIHLTAISLNFLGGPSTNPIPFDADSSTVKHELEALPTIA